jgi:glycosyltransferase involved in cell wall biosynthesis
MGNSTSRMSNRFLSVWGEAQVGINAIKVAFGSVPKDGGTFTFYRNLRPALQDHGISLQCVTVGKKEAALVESTYVDSGCVLLAAESEDVREQAQSFAVWCHRESIDIVIAVNSVAILSALPYLPRYIRVLSRCANGFEEGYRVTLSGGKRLMKIIALTPRLKTDLVEKYAVQPSQICLIPNGIDPAPFETSFTRNRYNTGHNSPIKLGFMGRLEHSQKGVLYLPKIVRELKRQGVPFCLKIAGKGVHRLLLEKELKPFIESGEVKLIGSITKDEVPSFLKTIDVFLFTSRFEGCPNALLEAMMAGCVPVSFLIEGITNFLIDHGHTGFIAPAGNCEVFANYIFQLANNRELLKRISDSGALEARKRFDAKVTAKQYADLFHNIMQAPIPVFELLPWSQFKVDSVYKTRWTAYVPTPIRKFAKNVISSRVKAF